MARHGFDFKSRALFFAFTCLVLLGPASCEKVESGLRRDKRQDRQVISGSRQRSKIRTSITDETNYRVRNDQLVRENIRINIDAEEESQVWHTGKDTPVLVARVETYSVLKLVKTTVFNNSLSL